jgi:hypothetical protein
LLNPRLTRSARVNVVSTTCRWACSPVRWLCWISAVSALAEFHQPAVFHSPVRGLYQRCSAAAAAPAQAWY